MLKCFLGPALLNPTAVVKVNVKITVAAFIEDMFLLSASPFVLLTISDPGFSGYLFNYSAKKGRRKRTDANSIREGCLALPPFSPPHPPESPGGDACHIPEVGGSCLLTTNRIKLVAPQPRLRTAGRSACEYRVTTAFLSPATTHTQKRNELAFSQTSE